MTPEEVKATNEALVRDYRLTFNSPAGQRVLLDLMAFCRFRVPLGDPIKVDEGKRLVFLRIENFLSFSPEQLQRLFSGLPTPLEGDKADARPGPQSES